MKTYEFTWDGFSKAKNIDTKKLLKNKELKNTFIVCTAVLSYYDTTLAKSDSIDAGIWKCVSIAQEGLFYMGILIALLGLYIILFKKNDDGKKLIITAVGTYIGSYLVPKGFILLRSLLTQL
ncbi:MAG: hypothetical protein LKF87_14905 [Clostridium tyrobutyricum]|jgi:hypothetical protein|uniref:hypothetical protein n=1 Tax=Clostridium tyrobutyricum TaxID=1519 RepID=UPI0011C9B483|nr:hypothetical protein [Clostridium tyrobutyricum]MCH4200724.1 hypothetical protein [Clostridium tyrobutyricum]MCH4260204.1 hypothetical protein [Clostridium tyrobutyricum]